MGLLGQNETIPMRSSETMETKLSHPRERHQDTLVNMKPLRKQW